MGLCFVLELFLVTDSERKHAQSGDADTFTKKQSEKVSESTKIRKIRKHSVDVSCRTLMVGVRTRYERKMGRRRGRVMRIAGGK